MATIGNLLFDIQSLGIPIDSINSSGDYVVTSGETLTQPQIDTINSLFAVWDAQPPGQKKKSDKQTTSEIKATSLYAALDAFVHVPDVSTLNNNEFEAYVELIGDTINSIKNDLPDIFDSLGVETT